MRVFLFLAFVVLAGLLLLFRGDIDFLSDMGTLEIVILAGGLLLVAAYIAVLLSGERHQPMQAIRYLLIWAAIGLALVAVYSYREDFAAIATRVAGELTPAGRLIAVSTTEDGERAVRVRRRLDGHFVVRASVNGQSMTLLVDTGATTVVLKPADAEQAGVDTGDLNYTVAVQTANGTTYAAPVHLRSLAIGPLMVRDVHALVAPPGSLNENLLGMSFLRRLRSYEFSKDYLTLRG
jgi:aspartyl protease family protein